MFKKLLSTLTVMLFVFGMNAGAQELQMLNVGKMKPMLSNGMVTSNIQLTENEFWWGYFDGVYDGNSFGLGLGQQSPKQLDYDACFCIPAGAGIAEGKTIKGISFSMPGSLKNMSDFKVWIYAGKTLPENFADNCVTTQVVTNPTGALNQEDPINQVRFDKPYKIDPNLNTYVGFSFKINNVVGEDEMFPIYVKALKPTAPNELYIRATPPTSPSQGTGWMDCQGQDFGCLAALVLFEGSFDANSVSIPSKIGEYISVKNTKVSLPVRVENYGTNGINDIDIAVTIDGKEFKKNVKAPSKITGVTTPFDFLVDIDVPENTGYYEIKVVVEKVNGEVNANKNNVGVCNIRVLSRATERKPVVEEFTGTWCGYCPIGLVALEKARGIYKDKVVLISIHEQNNDPMTCNDYIPFVQGAMVQGFPEACIDRTYFGFNPYFGKKVYMEWGLGELIDASMEQLPVAEVKVSGVIDGNTLTAKSTVKFLYTGDAKYALAYVVTKDGLSDPSWRQSNYLRGDKKYNFDPLFEKWIKGGGSVKNVVFDDVAIAAKGITEGVKNSIPTTVKEEEAVEHEITFDLSKYKFTKDNKDNINICVLLIDKTTGVIVNADYVKAADLAGIDGVDADDENVVEVARYTIDGRRIYTAQKGVNIVKYSDGKVKKVIVK